MQYFERVRMEYHPENQPPYDVLLGQFGRRILAENDLLGTTTRTGFGLLYISNEDVRRNLGVPTAPAVHAPGATQAFERGRMYYRSDTQRIYVFCGGVTGIVLLSPQGEPSFPDNWVEGQDPGGGPAPQPGLYYPQRGFGKLWRENQRAHDCLGYAPSATETAYTFAAQQFQHGFMLAGAPPEGNIIYTVPVGPFGNGSGPDAYYLPYPDPSRQGVVCLGLSRHNANTTGEGAMTGRMMHSRPGTLVASLVSVLLALTLGPLARPASAATQIYYPTFAAQAFQQIWERLDHPVYYGDTSRSYTWGGQVGGGLPEPYQEGTDGQHLVQYFDKSRMEINNPDADPNDPFFVTQGLLARDLIRGEFQVGNTAFVPAPQGPAQIPFGDLDDTQAVSPVYASFKAVLGAPPAPADQAITARLNRAGNVSDDLATASYGVTSAGVIPGTPATTPGFNQHAIADVFLAYIQQSGLVYQNGQNVTAPLYAPIQSVFGFPITEAYWATVRAGGENRTVLIQCFERRCLTYTPANDPAFRVEMANTGLQYYNWRYRQGASGPQGAWSPAATPALALPTALLPLPDGQILLLGVAGHGSLAPQSQRYNPATNTWSTPAPLALPGRSSYAVAQLADGSVLVNGGVDFNITGQTRTVASVERYDPATDSWHMVAPQLTPRAGATATLLADGRVLVAGGDPKDDFSGYTLASAELYDPARDTWTATGSMALPRMRHTATRLPDGRVLVTGGLAGQTDSLAPTAETELYDPATGHWTVAAPMRIPRTEHTATLLANGQVLVIGTALDPALMAERYDPAANRWLPTAPLPTPLGIPGSRTGFTLTPLPNGQALLTGGQVLVPRNTGGRYPIPNALADTARYDPVADRWITDAPLSTPRAFHQAALLPNGRILVVGDDQRQTGGYAVYTAEMYIPPR